MSARRGFTRALGDLVGGLLPLSVRDLTREARRSHPQGSDAAQRVRLRPVGPPSGDGARHDPARAGALQVLLPRRDPRHRARPAGSRAADREPRGPASLRRRDGLRRDAARGRAAAHRARHGRVLGVRAALGLDVRDARRRCVGHARHLSRDARGRRGGAGLSRRRARHEQALQGPLQAAALRHRLHAPRARSADADRAARDRRIRRAAARLREPEEPRPRARDAGLPDHRDVPAARPARHAAVAREVPLLFRRAAALHAARPPTTTR